jgi:hypothetical protein
MSGEAQRCAHGKGANERRKPTGQQLFYSTQFTHGSPVAGILRCKRSGVVPWHFMVGSYFPDLI